MKPRVGVKSYMPLEEEEEEEEDGQIVSLGDSRIEQPFGYYKRVKS